MRSRLYRNTTLGPSFTLLSLKTGSYTAIFTLIPWAAPWSLKIATIMPSCTLVALSWLEQIHREDIMRGKTPSSNFSWPWRCPYWLKKVAGPFLAMHREVTWRKSNHRFFSYLYNCYDPPWLWLIQKWIFLQATVTLSQKQFKDVCFACYTHWSESLGHAWL